jgi:ATP-dependent RNA helicase DeaD
VAEHQKFDTLCRLLDMHPPELALVFCRTKRRVDDVAEGLVKRSYMAGAIHGDMPQAKREAVLDKFRRGQIDILVATDVAARGWDVAGISHIYNFDVPQDSDSYVHRIGRTGRAGKSGNALTLITHRERHHLRQIEQQTGANIKPIQPPSSDDALRSQQQKVADKILAAARKGPGQSYQDMARQLLEDSPPDLVLAAALKMLTREPQTTPVTIDLERRYNAPRRQPSGPRPRRR